MVSGDGLTRCCSVAMGTHGNLPSDAPPCHWRRAPVPFLPRFSSHRYHRRHGPHGTHVQKSQGNAAGVSLVILLITPAPGPFEPRTRRPSAQWMHRALTCAAGRLSCFSPKHLSQLLWAVATVGYRPPAPWTARALAKARDHFRTSDARTLSGLAWAVAAMGHRPDDVWLRVGHYAARGSLRAIAGQERSPGNESHCRAWRAIAGVSCA